MCALKMFLRFLRLNDMETRKERQKTDPLPPVRVLVDTITNNLLAAYSPGQWLSVHLCRYRGRCDFKQSIPSKPDRYGINIYILADSKNYYPLNFEIYCGKQELFTKPEDLVIRLTKFLSPCHVICADNYFTSLIYLIIYLETRKFIS